ncbi:MAG: putative manganese-dependent inorganic diphosphatase [Bacilli bacterium]|nr:putative manganese-dependent inorganic diphosphatase [Bacilli bacterium]
MVYFDKKEVRGMRKTFIFGHKKPDSDSVMAAIGLSYLKNKLGDNTEPRVLGNINKESSFALKYFGLKEPKYLNDVKLQLKDVNYHKKYFIKDTESIYDGYQAMLKAELTGIPVVKSDNTFLGLVTLKDLSHVIINENVEDLYTSYDNLLHVLKGEEILRCTKEIIGKILVAAYRSTTFISNVKLTPNDILIVGDRHSLLEYAVNSSVKLIILTNDCYIKEEHVEIARKNGVSIIRTPYDTYRVSRLVALANYIKTMIKVYNPTKFVDTDFISDVIDINNKLKHTNYPVVDKNNKCLGLLKITDLSEKHPKNVMLVDHNEKLQSVEGLDEANILEIFDYHNLGSITTGYPINFRNMAVGSTCTIIYTLYKESNVEIPREIAGALLSGILSDTLILKSPTATAIDEKAVTELSKIAEVDYYDYGMELLKSGTSLDGMSKEDVLYNDYKLFNVNDKNFAIGQFFTMNFDDIEKEMDGYIHVLDEVAESNNYALVALYVTDIIKNGSYVIFSTKGKGIMDVAYQKDMSEGAFIDGCVSRKRNVVPLIMEVFEN